MNFDIPPGALALIGINAFVFLLQMLLGDGPFLALALWPVGTDFLGGPSFGIWQVVTYGFLHGGLWHLFFNMFAVFMFGSEIERLFGTRWFLGYFLVCIVTAGIAQLAVAAVTNAPAYPTVGASGGVFGVLLAFGMYFPRRTIVLVIPPIPLPAWLFVTGYGLLELYFGVSGRAPGVAHFAHLGGMIGGFTMIMWRRKAPPRRRRK